MSKQNLTVDSDPGDIGRAKDAAKDLLLDLEWIMSKPRGRRWMHRFIFEVCHVEVRSHVAGCSDTTAYNDGYRMAGQDVLTDIRMNHHNEYMLMLQENASG